MSTHSSADNAEAGYQETNRENHIYRDHYRNMDICRPGMLTSLGHSTGSGIYSELGTVLKYLLNYVYVNKLQFSNAASFLLPEKGRFQRGFPSEDEV